MVVRASAPLESGGDLYLDNALPERKGLDSAGSIIIRSSLFKITFNCHKGQGDLLSQQNNKCWMNKTVPLLKTTQRG